MKHLTPELEAFLAEWLPAAPARLLEVGCGSGELTRRLSASGYDATGLDPEAPKEPGFIRAGIEDFESSQPFDAALAVRSLHHVADPARAVASLEANLRPGGRLLLFEFAVEAVDDAATAWLDEQGVRHPVVETELEAIIPLATLTAAIEERFRLLAREPAPYLAREGERVELEPQELAEVEAGRLRAAGARLAYQRR